jgi:hypothetical protein
MKFEIFKQYKVGICLISQESTKRKFEDLSNLQIEKKKISHENGLSTMRRRAGMFKSRTSH